MQAQAPLWHVVPDGHFVPHLPQLPGSLSGLTHAPPQRISGEGQTHWPPWQDAPAGHALLHAPQLAALVIVSTHDADFPGGAHMVSWPGHPQKPFWQGSPAPQVTPHVPQLFGSLCRKTQRPAHSVQPPSKNNPVSGPPSGGGGARMSAKLTTSPTVASRGPCEGPSPGIVESVKGDGAPSVSGVDASLASSRSWNPQIEAHAGKPNVQPIVRTTR